MHYGGHLREAFCDWIAADCPPKVELEDDYEPVIWSAERFLRRMLRCSDVLPGYVRDDVESMFPEITEPETGAALYSYGGVARWLLANERESVTR